MERFAWFYHEILEQAATVKANIAALIRKLPYLGNLSDGVIDWVFIALVFVALIAIIYPLLKWSLKISVAAVAIAGLLAFFTSMSFWGILPFTGLAVAIVIFSNKFQTE